MRAMLMSKVGGPEVLRLGEVETPKITADRQLLVRLKAAGVNPVDTKLRSRGTYYPDRSPTVLGCDGAGVVETVGAGAARFKPGDEVYFCHGGIGGPTGNYAEYAVLDERFAARKPASISFAEAGAAPLVLITAWESLYDRASMEAGQKVLIHAGAGGVGHVAIQLAKAAGCQVITTVSSEEKREFVQGLGADAAVNYRSEDFVEAVLAWSGGEGVDIALDTVGGEVFQKTFAAVRPYGEVVSLLQPGPETDWKVARLRNIRTSSELMLSPMYFGWSEAQVHQVEILERCAGLFDGGKLRVHLAHTLPLEQAAEAHRLIEQGGTMGKIVLTMD